MGIKSRKVKKLERKASPLLPSKKLVLQLIRQALMRNLVLLLVLFLLLKCRLVEMDVTLATALHHKPQVSH